jgi:hypothetical protein
LATAGVHRELDMMDEQYTEHEVRLRVFEERFQVLEEKFARGIEGVNTKLNVIIGVWGALFTSAIIPVLLHHYNLS